MMCCEIDCIMNAIGLLTNGKFDPAKANSVLAAQLSSGWTKDVINSVVTTCLAKGELLTFLIVGNGTTFNNLF